MVRGRGNVVFCAAGVDIRRNKVKVVVRWEDLGVGPEFLVRTGSNIEEIASMDRSTDCPCPISTSH